MARIPHSHTRTFQNFVLMPDPLGVTHINDVTAADAGKIRSLALIELTALFDTNNLSHTPRKHKKRLKGQSGQREGQREVTRSRR